MKYNLTKYSYVTSSGTINFTSSEIITIINNIDANIPITSTGTIVFDCDLGSRVHTSEIGYYFTVSGIASDIKFYWKNESFENYTELTTIAGANYYYASTPGIAYAPRYIRIQHTLTITGTVNGFVIYNNEDYVDFGTNADEIDHNINATLDTYTAQIDELAVYNSSSKTASAKVFIEPQNTAIDDLLSISDTISGTYYGIYQDDDKIAGTGMWDTGAHNNTQIVSDQLRLDTGQTDGYYTTKIFSLESTQRLTHIVSNYIYPSISGIVAVEAADTYETVEVKSSNSRPEDRVTYIDLYNNGSDVYIRHTWALDGTTASDEFDTGEDTTTYNFFEVFHDDASDSYYVVSKRYPVGFNNINVSFYIFRDGGSTKFELNRFNNNINNDFYFSLYKITYNSLGGFWMYYYLGNVDTGYTNLFYLDYYDSTLTLVYRRTGTDDDGSFLYDLSADYNTSNIWYTDIDQAGVFKTDTSGAFIASKSETVDIRGIAALSDGGCWYIRDDELVRLNTDAEEIDSFTLPTNTCSYVYLDKTEDGFWIHDSNDIYYLDISGNQIFTVNIPNLVIVTSITTDGMIVKIHDGSTTVPPQASYISKYYKRVMRTWDYPTNEGGLDGTFDYNRLGSRSNTYDDPNYSSYFPITIDDDWQVSAKWKKVSLRNYNFSNELYHQIRIGLHADSSANSPRVYGLWTQRAIELPNILPGNYAKFYLKSNTSSLNENDTGTYTSNIRAWWFVEES